MMTTSPSKYRTADLMKNLVMKHGAVYPTLTDITAEIIIVMRGCCAGLIKHISRMSAYIQLDLNDRNLTACPYKGLIVFNKIGLSYILSFFPTDLIPKLISGDTQQQTADDFKMKAHTKWIIKLVSV